MECESFRTKMTKMTQTIQEKHLFENMMTILCIWEMEEEQNEGNTDLKRVLRGNSFAALALCIVQIFQPGLDFLGSNFNKKIKIHVTRFCFRGKLTAFLQLEEFSLRNRTVDFTTTSARRSSHSLKQKSAAP